MSLFDRLIEGACEAQSLPVRAIAKGAALAIVAGLWLRPVPTTHAIERWAERKAQAITRVIRAHLPDPPHSHARRIPVA